MFQREVMRRGDLLPSFQLADLAELDKFSPRNIDPMNKKLKGEYSSSASLRHCEHGLWHWNLRSKVASGDATAPQRNISNLDFALARGPHCNLPVMPRPRGFASCEPMTVTQKRYIYILYIYK